MTLDKYNVNEVSSHRTLTIDPSNPIAAQVSAFNMSVDPARQLNGSIYIGKVVAINGIHSTPAAIMPESQSPVPEANSFRPPTYRVQILDDKPLSAPIEVSQETALAPALQEAIRLVDEFEVIPGLSDSILPMEGDMVYVGFRQPNAPAGRRGGYVLGIHSSDGPLQYGMSSAMQAFRGGDMTSPNYRPHKSKAPGPGAQEYLKKAVAPPFKCQAQIPMLKMGVGQKMHSFGFKGAMKIEKIDFFLGNLRISAGSTASGGNPFGAVPAFKLLRHALAQDPASLRYFAESRKSKSKTNPRGIGGLVTRCIQHQYKFPLSPKCKGPQIVESGKRKGKPYWKCPPSAVGEYMRSFMKNKSTVDIQTVTHKAANICLIGLSNHSFGTAVDINPKQNPHSKPFTTDLPPSMVAIFKKLGFFWGGEYKKPDPMHFEFLGDPHAAKDAWNPCQKAIKDGQIPDYYEENWVKRSKDPSLYPPGSADTVMINPKKPWHVKNPGSI